MTKGAGGRLKYIQVVDTILVLQINVARGNCWLWISDALYCGCQYPGTQVNAIHSDRLPVINYIYCNLLHRINVSVMATRVTAHLAQYFRLCEAPRLLYTKHGLKWFQTVPLKSMLKTTQYINVSTSWCSRQQSTLRSQSGCVSLHVAMMYSR